MIRGDNHLVLDNMRDDFPDLVQWIHEHGRPSKPGGKLAYELRSVNLTLLDPLDALPLGTGSKFNQAMAALEALQVISGHTNRLLMYRIKSDSFPFPVGERIAGQLHGVAQDLLQDGQSRQAVATVWDPLYDAQGKKRPCTLSFQFFWRDDKLELHVNSRSADVLLLPELNLFPAAQLHVSMARFLGTNVGNFEYHVGSLHLNASDIGALDHRHNTTELVRPFVPLGFGDGSEQLWQEVADRARFVLDVGAGRIVEGVNPNAFSETEKWYLNELRPYWVSGG